MSALQSSTDSIRASPCVREGSKGDIPGLSPHVRLTLESGQARIYDLPYAKPPTFAEIIEEMFPFLPRLEMFARAPLNGQIGDFIRSTAAEMVLIPFPDRHVDHRVTFDACVVACRPSHPDAPRVVLAYETLSETHWNVPGIEPAFVPELFIDVTSHMPKKQAALECYASQIKHAPSRTVEACTALARFRGSQNGCEYAEAFKVVRIVI
jgi:LmbE family N-acetylglucosaminyl deacetylase